MKPIAASRNPIVLRTDFSNTKVWEATCKTIRKPVGFWRFRAKVEFVDDEAYRDLTQDQVFRLIPRAYEHGFIVLADRITMTHPEHPVLVVDLYDEPGRSFRALASQIQAIENNLSIANMDFFEFAEAVDARGIFRGFRRG